MAVSKVILNNVTLIDVTADTVAESNLLTGYQATGADGEQVIGAYEAPDPVITSLVVTPSETSQTFEGAVAGGNEILNTSIRNTSPKEFTPSLTPGTLYYATVKYYMNDGYYLAGETSEFFTCVESGASLDNGRITITNNTVKAEDSANIANYDFVRIIVKDASSVDGYKPVTVEAIPDTYVGSAIERRNENSITVSGRYVTTPSGYYEGSSTKSVATGSARTPATTIAVTPDISIDSSTGVITARNSDSKSITPTVSAGYVTSGTAGTVTINGSETKQLPTQGAATITPTKSEQTAVLSGKYTLGDVKVAPIPSQYIVPSGELEITENGISNVTNYASVDVNVQPSLQSKTATPAESAQVIEADSGYYGLSAVSVEAIDSEYVGSDIERRAASDLTVNGATVNVPSGYYSQGVSKSVASGISGTPTATKSSVSGNSVTITPSVTNSEGYISGGTLTGDPISVQASELVSGTKTVTQNGTEIDVTNYADVTVNVQPDLQNKAVTPTEASQTITADDSYDGLNEVTVGAVSPTYVGSQIDRNDSSDLSVNGANVSVPSGYYAESASASVATGSASTPATTISINRTNCTVVVDENGRIITSINATEDVTPEVVGGYISSGIAGTITVSGNLTTAMVTKEATTYTPGTADQTISAGRYITGTQTIKGDENLIANNIANGVTIFGVQGSLERATSLTAAEILSAVQSGWI